jgi:pimeloyl-ACP methyl ester carboxylesterase
MPKHGGRTISQLLTRHLDALEHIHRRFRNATAIYGEGLGGYVAFYLALAHAPVVSLVCQNAPAILTEAAYHHALLTDSGPWRGATRRRRVMLPAAARLVRWVPKLKVPLSSYLPWRDLVDTRQGSQEIEQRLVISGYLQDPDFDRWYPLEAVMSLVTTPPPGRLEELTTPTMFIVASEGPTPTYIADLYERLADIPRRLVRVEGSVYWMLSHPHDAAALVSDWIAATS